MDTEHDRQTEDQAEDQTEDQQATAILQYLRDLELRFARWIHRQPNVATALRRLRDRQDLSLAEASARAGISSSYLSHLEHGRHAPLHTLARLGGCAYSLTGRMVNELLAFALECEERDRALAWRAQSRRGVEAVEVTEADARAVTAMTGTTRQLAMNCEDVQHGEQHGEQQ